MHITYEPFRKWFWNNHPTKKKVDVVKETGLPRGTIYHLFKDEPVSVTTIDTICTRYNLRVDEVMLHKKEDI